MILGSDYSLQKNQHLVSSCDQSLYKFQLRNATQLVEVSPGYLETVELMSELVFLESAS